MTIEINFKQTQNLLELFGGEEAEMTVQHIREGNSGPGLYAWCSDYREDGSNYLGPGDDDEFVTTPGPSLQRTRVD